MRLLPNGKYEIVNKKTGEKKEVSKEELSKYGLSVPSDDPEQGGNFLDKLKKFSERAPGNIGEAVGATPTLALPTAGYEGIRSLLMGAGRGAEKLSGLTDSPLLNELSLGLYKGASKPNPFISESREARLGGQEGLEGQARQVGGDILKTATNVIPFGKEIAGAQKLPAALKYPINLATKAAIPGAVSSVGYAGSEALEEGQPFSKEDAAKAAAKGAAFSTAFQITADVVVGGVKLVAGKDPKEQIMKTVKPSNQKVEDFESVTGKDFAQEFIERDLDSVAGSDYKKLSDYSQKQYDKAKGTADKVLSQVEGDYTMDVINMIDDKMAQVKNPQTGQIYDPESLRTLQWLRDNIVDPKTNAIKQQYTNLGQVNTLKRNLAEKGAAAYGGTSSISTKTIADLEGDVRGFIERTYQPVSGPGAKEINETTMYYRLLRDSLTREKTKEMKAASTIWKTLATTPGGIYAGLGLMSGKPALAFMGFTPALISYASKKPQISTKLAQFLTGPQKLTPGLTAIQKIGSQQVGR